MWPQEYIELKYIEDLLVCGICYEYMETSVITSCSHNYCSLCIRKYLHYKTQCPACFAETFEKDLRKNKVLDEIITQFSQIKDKLKKCLRSQMQFLPFNRSDIILNSPKSTPKNKDKHLIKLEDKIVNKRLISESNTSPSINVQKDLSSPSTSGNSRIPLMFTPKSTKSANVTVVEKTADVICPVCKVTISELHINKHLDDCLKRESRKVQPQTVQLNRKPLPKLVFTLMKEGVIRKKLKEFGLSTQGDRKAMEARLQRYIILYNAECDKSYPRPVSELIKQCEDEESLEKNIYKTSSFINKLHVNRNTEQNVIDVERKKYLETYKDSFESLIRKIKHTNPPRHSSARRNLLNESIQNNESTLDKQEKDENSDDSVVETDKDNFLPLNSGAYIEDSDSDADCPLQMYSSTYPTKLLNVELSPPRNNIPKNKCETNYEKDDHTEVKSSHYSGIQRKKDDANLDMFNDTSVSNKEMNSITDTTLGKDTSEADSKTSKYEVLLQRKKKLFRNDETKRMNSFTSARGNCDSNYVSDQEGADGRSTSVLQDVVCDLSSNDSNDTKYNYENKLINMANMEKENINSKSSDNRSLRKRNRDLVQNDNKIVSNVKKKVKKASRHYHSETDESSNEESVRILNDNENLHLQNKPQLRNRVLNTSTIEETTVLRKSTRVKLKNNI
ncbi:uncharacterized protein LOC128876771 isoform X1 [Hylaeus volcanicus]|uniref:uncharacterized protein LOC128876771 isoform X1 n=1 Tax=Hylaeus volcanicus TaxID=313075 RepID=UPI0023B7F544|nr:uncharacterized protein LOC128876771 isoform X1 [Hylaeus volcanicus]